MNGVVNIRGKEYKTVALRVSEFREAHKQELGIQTELVRNDEIVIIKAIVVDRNGFTIATGYAEEVRGSSQINKTSALENCETSAIGRALACLGFGGTEYASANEVQNAIHQQNAPAPKTPKQILWELVDQDLDLLDDLSMTAFGKAGKELSDNEIQQLINERKAA